MGRLRLEAVHVSKSHKTSGATHWVRRLNAPASHRKTEAVENELEHVDDFTEPSRNRTLLLMRLCLASYPTCSEQIEYLGEEACIYPSDVMEDIYEKGWSIFGPNITNQQQEEQAMDNLAFDNWNLLLGGNEGYSSFYQAIDIPRDTAEYQFGVHALEWTDVETGTTILAFRGTLTDGDYANIENWIANFLIEKSTQRMKDAWTQDAGLEWTEEMQQRASQTGSDAAERLFIRAGETYVLHQQSLPSLLSTEVSNNATLSDSLGGLSEEEVAATGYWKITKYIVDQVASACRDSGNTLVLTGHSQGGTRAQLATMYLRQEYGGTFMPYTVTFAATGSACVARLMFHKNADLLAAVNPFVEHENIVEYSHPLDPWGNSMLGVDNGGNVCFMGNSRFTGQASETDHVDGAFHYCSQIYGFSGPTIIANQNGLALNLDQNTSVALEGNFERCRYFTHLAEAMLLSFLQSDVLMDDGTTDGGCRNITTIPADDPDGLCPIGELNRGEKKLLVMTSLVTILCFAVSLALICTVCRRIVSRPKRRHSLHTPLQQGESEAFESSSDIELPRMS